MGQVSTIGLDIAKNLFQIHGVDADGTVVIRKRVSRARVLEFFADLPPCRVGMEACAYKYPWVIELRGAFAFRSFLPSRQPVLSSGLRGSP